MTVLLFLSNRLLHALTGKAKTMPNMPQKRPLRCNPQYSKEIQRRKDAGREAVSAPLVTPHDPGLVQNLTPWDAP